MIGFCPLKNFVFHCRKGMYIIAPAVPILNMAVINTLFILQVRPTTSNLISLVKLLMLSIWFNVACVIYNILEKLNVASKTVLMNTDDLYSTLLVITSILQFQNTFLPAIICIPTMICFWFLLKNLKMGVILSGKHVKPTFNIHKAKTIEPLGINKRDEL